MTDREITKTDLENVERAIGGNEAFLKDLYVLRKILGEIGKLDYQGIKRGVEAEQVRLDEVRKQANSAQSSLDDVLRQIAEKRLELAAVEAEIAERTTVSNQINEGIIGLRSMLAAA
jgi:hypothetical protein